MQMQLICLLVLVLAVPASAQNDLKSQTVTAMREAAGYYVENVATHGGNVYHYSLDLKQRWGEGVATTDQVWI